MQESERDSRASDGILILQARGGDEAAFERLVHRYRPGLLAFSCQLMRNLSDAEDVVQTVFLKLYLALPTLHVKEPLKPWLFQVTRNCCYDELRRKRAWSFSEVESEEDDNGVTHLGMLMDPHPSLEEHMEQQELQAVIQQSICALPQKYHAIVRLRYTSLLSYAEIAETLHIPESTAKTYVHRAKPRLRAALHTHKP